MSGRSWLLAVLALSLFGALNWTRQGFITRAEGVLVASAPQQSAPRHSEPLERGDFTLTPLADFSLEARVLSRADYRFDAESALSPTDLALGWGRMSDSRVLARLDVRQGRRAFRYRWLDEPPIPPREIIRSSANMHMIPADDAVARELAGVRAGDLIRLRGQLVQAKRGDGWRWTSSLTRDDTGDGACELVLLREISRRAATGPG